MTDIEGTVTGAGAPRAADPAGPREGGEHDASPGTAPGEGSAAAAGAQGTDGAEGTDGAAKAPAGPPAGRDDAKDVEGDLDELVRTAAQRDEYLALAQRTQADFENYRKRVAREAAAAQERGCAMLAKELLPALDNLDRALEAAAKDDPLLEGVRLVRAELTAALGRAGIEAFSPLGEVFDPSVHEAMASVPQPPDGRPSGTVVEVYQPGYTLGESLIRPARVVVAA